VNALKLQAFTQEVDGYLSLAVRWDIFIEVEPVALVYAESIPASQPEKVILKNLIESYLLQ
jgi:hypothetical protein